MNIDFHIHTSERSNCAKSTESEQIEKAIASGLDAIAITDHHQLVPMAHLADLNRRYQPLLILNGIEITAQGEDWLVLGLPDPDLEREDWVYSDLHTYVRSKGGILVLAHPYRYHSEIAVDLIQFRPDAIEGRSNNIREDTIPRIRNLAQRLQLPTLCNSDAHITYALGKYYNIVHKRARNEGEILAELKSGKLHHSI